jgi:hypothetical protein
MGVNDMIAASAAILLSLAAVSANPVDTSRKAYSNCMRTIHNESVKAKASVTDFTEKAKSACEAERTDFNAALVRSERSFGSSAKEADFYAAEEISLIIDSMITAFSDNVGEGSTLAPEK